MRTRSSPAPWCLLPVSDVQAAWSFSNRLVDSGRSELAPGIGICRHPAPKIGQHADAVMCSDRSHIERGQTLAGACRGDCMYRRLRFWKQTGRYDEAFEHMWRAKQLVAETNSIRGVIRSGFPTRDPILHEGPSHAFRCRGPRMAIRPARADRRHAAFGHFVDRADSCEPSAGSWSGRTPRAGANCQRAAGGRLGERDGFTPGVSIYSRFAKPTVWLDNILQSSIPWTRQQPTSPTRCRKTHEWLGLPRKYCCPIITVIHCIRDPRDTCLSCFLTNFDLGNAFSNDLAHLASYYRDYQRQMRHWKDVLSVPMLDVRYEEVVADPRGQTRRVLDFLNLPWDERCLAFHENQRVVNTASRDQVRRPMYSSSVGRWKKYEKNIGELLGLAGA